LSFAKRINIHQHYIDTYHKISVVCDKGILKAKEVNYKLYNVHRDNFSDRYIVTKQNRVSKRKLSRSQQSFQMKSSEQQTNFW